MASYSNAPYPQSSAPIPMPNPPHGPLRTSSHQSPRSSYDPQHAQPFPPFQPGSLPTIPSQQALYPMPMQGQPQPQAPPLYQQPSYGQPSYTAQSNTPQSYTPQSHTPQSYTPQYTPQYAPQQTLQPGYAGATQGYPFGEPNPQMMARPAYDPRRISQSSQRSMRSTHSHHSRRSKYDDDSDDDEDEPPKHHHHHHHHKEKDKYKETRPTMGDSMFAAFDSIKKVMMGK